MKYEERWALEVKPSYRSGGIGVIAISVAVTTGVLVLNANALPPLKNPYLYRMGIPIACCGSFIYGFIAPEKFMLWGIIALAGEFVPWFFQSSGSSSHPFFLVEVLLVASYCAPTVLTAFWGKEAQAWYQRRKSQ